MPAPKKRLQAAIEAGETNAIDDVLGFPAAAVLSRSHLAPDELTLLALATAHTPQPAVALERLVQLAERLEMPPHQWDPTGARALAASLGGSDAVGRYVAVHPDFARPLLRGEFVRVAKPKDRMRDEGRRLRATTVGDAELVTALQRYRAREWVRIVSRELARLEPVDVIVGELSDLADVIIDTSTRYYLRRERSRNGPRTAGGGLGGPAAALSVIAQGKLGGRELNVSSDVDLQFVFSRGLGSSDAMGSSGTSQSSTAADNLHQRFTNVAQRIVQSLSRRGADGFCYRVDLDLRPEGKKGTLVNSVTGAEHYYETWGQSWERLALIRARHVGGAAWVSRELLDTLRPWIYPRSVDSTTVDEIRSLKERVERERLAQEARRGAPGRRLGPHGGVDIKRDAGCIREVELFVQMLQLLYGGRDASLQTPSFWRATERLLFAGVLGRDDAVALVEAYRFLRRVENALQALDERQTHRLPDDPEELTRISRLLGVRAQRGRNERLTTRIARRRRAVRRVTEPLFGTPAVSRRADPATLAASSEGEVRVRALAALGFREPEEAAGALAALGNLGGSPFSEHTPERLRALAELLLRDMAQSPDPDQALRLYTALERRLRGRRGYYDLLFLPPVRRRLVDLLGTSEFLGQTILRYPELVDWLAQARDPVSLARRPSVDDLQDEITARLSPLADLELELRSLRRFRLQETLRVGLLDLNADFDIEEVLRQLSDLAEACLRATLTLARREVGPRTETDFATGFAVLGLGRLGSREMGYGSDLDLIFVYDDGSLDGGGLTGAEAARRREDAIRLAQRLISLLTYRPQEGRLYAIDTRLRPSGQQGPIVSSAAGFLQYHRDKAALWERQALLRARPVAGDLQLGARLLAALDDARYPRRMPRGAAAQMHAMRMRMERELAHETRSESNVKTGRGGLVDIQFIVHYLIFKHAHRHPKLAVTGLLAGIRRLAEAGVLSSRRAQLLERAYRFLRALENRLRMVHDRPIDAVQMQGAALDVLARRMGYSARGGRASRLYRDYVRTTERVRRIYASVLESPGTAQQPSPGSS